MEAYSERNVELAELVARWAVCLHEGSHGQGFGGTGSCSGRESGPAGGPEGFRADGAWRWSCVGGAGWFAASAARSRDTGYLCARLGAAVGSSSDLEESWWS